MPLRIIFIDLNSYFASVEQAENPKLMGKPVAVVPMLAENTCCIAASYPAKAYGIKTGTLVKDARKLCPKIIFVEACHSKYVTYHHKIIEAINRCLPVWKVFSIDEMAIRLFGREQNSNFAIAKAQEIKERILKEVHPALTCSIGIAPNRYVAKIASDLQKPDGLVVIQSEELPHRLFNLKLNDFPGIGPRMEQRFMEAGCVSAKILCQKTSKELEKLWGSKLGEEFWKLIHGDELEERETKRASISHSRVLPPNLRTPEGAWSNLVALTSKAAMRLRDEEFFAASLQIHLKFLRRINLNSAVQGIYSQGIYSQGLSTRSQMQASYWESRSRFLETQDTTIFLNHLSELWEKAPKENILKVGIVLSSLSPANQRQLSLWEDSKQENLMRAIDKINKNHRKNLVIHGSSIELQKPAQAPISFGHIPKDYE